METILGAFTRPWSKLDAETAAKDVASAGFAQAGLMKLGGKLLLDHASSDEDIARVKGVFEARGLGVETTLCYFDLADVEKGKEELRAWVDVAARASFKHLLTTGTHDEGRYDNYFSVVSDCAPYAAEKGVTIGLKFHGGMTATGEQCRQAVERVGRGGFGIWYDPGNIVYYDGLDPLEELNPVARDTVGVCIKDCQGGKKGSVAVTPGDGEVDFEGVFRRLDDAGFAGPMIVETLGPGEPAAEARRAFEFLSGLLR